MSAPVHTGPIGAAPYTDAPIRLASALRSRPVDGPHGKGAIVDAVVGSVWPMISGGQVRPVIGARFPITQAAEAHRALAAGRTFGKVLLTVPG